MKKNLFVFFLGLTLAGNSLSAQDQGIYSQFFMNPYIINSAYVGSTGYSTFFGTYRQQWVGLEGAPQSMYLSFHTPLENNLSIGGYAYNDNIDFINTSGGKITGGYLMQLDRKQFVRFGLSVGGGYSGYDVEAGNDPALATLSGTSFVTADIGATYYYNNFNVGISVPNLIGRETVSAESFSPIRFAPYENITINANYRHFINKTLSIEPHVIYRFSYVDMPQYEVAVIAHLGHVVWAGLNYRQDYGMAALAGFKIKEEWAIGFSYEYGATELDGFSSGTFELSLGYNMGKKKKKQKQSISFISNFKKTKAEEEKAARRRQQVAQQRQKAATEKAAEEAAIATVAVAATDPIEEPNDVELASDGTGIAIAYEAIDHSIPLQTRTDAGGIWEIGTTYNQTKVDSTKISTVKWSDALTATPDHDNLPPNTHRRVPGNILELPAGHHVIAGEFDSYEEAEDYSDKIFAMGFHGSLVGHLESLEGKKYVVVVHKGATMGIAMEEQEKWSKRKNLDHVYILNVVN
ncbi:MAG: type IX secretion system membrane protein PorP/SprF [Reichenbachiella sp.]